MSMNWKTISNRYGPDSQFLYLNKLHVATVAWDYGHSKTSPTSYRTDIHLPGMKSDFTVSRHSSEKEGVAFAENIVKRWVISAGLEFKQAVDDVKWERPFTFEHGATLTEPNQTVDSHRWCGPLPKIVPAGSTLATTGGIGPNAWVYVPELDGKHWS